MRNSSLWSSVCCRERSNFPRIWFRDLRFRVWGLEIEHPKAHNLVWPWCDKGVFSFINISQLRRPKELKFSQVFYCMHTPSEKTGLWQSPIVQCLWTKWNGLGCAINSLDIRQFLVSPCQVGLQIGLFPITEHGSTSTVLFRPPWFNQRCMVQGWRKMHEQNASS